jgi:hypothetical protein
MLRGGVGRRLRAPVNFFLRWLHPTGARLRSGLMSAEAAGFGGLAASRSRKRESIVSPPPAEAAAVISREADWAGGRTPSLPEAFRSVAIPEMHRSNRVIMVVDKVLRLRAEKNRSDRNLRSLRTVPMRNQEPLNAHLQKQFSLIGAEHA